jgi:hypothetical protein
MTAQLPSLPYDEWVATKDTLHLYAQVLGKVRLAATPMRNHWWNVPLYVTARGVTTGALHLDGTDFDIELDVLENVVVFRTDDGSFRRLVLHDGLAVADFWRGTIDLLAELGLHPDLVPTPFGVPMTTPFPDDVEHATYDADAVRRWWTVLRWNHRVLSEFAGWFCGKASPVHLFWHSFDLAHTRFSGRRAPVSPDADPVTAQAYSHEAISFGWWAGDARTPFPAYYSYTAPEPEGLADHRLRPDAAEWQPSGDSGHLALLRYEDVRTAVDPERLLLDFLQSAYEAGATAAGWDVADLTTDWCPVPPPRRLGT